jgi:hypothetical protein
MFTFEPVVNIPPLPYFSNRFLLDGFFVETGRATKLYKKDFGEDPSKQYEIQSNLPGLTVR